MYNYVIDSAVYAIRTKLNRYKNKRVIQPFGAHLGGTIQRVRISKSYFVNVIVIMYS